MASSRTALLLGFIYFKVPEPRLVYGTVHYIVMICGLAGRDQCFGETYYLHHKG
jgi:hypothetical protein